MIAGFERPDAGQVELGGRDVSRLPPFERDVNTVFQDYALFPHMTVQQNVEYGLGEARPQVRAADAGRGGAPGWCGSRATATGSPRSSRAASASASRSPGDRQHAARAAARRASRRPRPEAAAGAADRAEADPAAARDDVRLRHPRSGRGAHDERPDRGLQPGAHRAGRTRRRRCTSIRGRRSSPASSARRTSSTGTGGRSPSARRRSACLSGDGPEGEPGTIRAAVYLGPFDEARRGARPRRGAHGRSSRTSRRPRATSAGWKVGASGSAGARRGIRDQGGRRDEAIRVLCTCCAVARRRRARRAGGGCDEVGRRADVASARARGSSRWSRGRATRRSSGSLRSRSRRAARWPRSTRAAPTTCSTS